MENCQNNLAQVYRNSSSIQTSHCGHFKYEESYLNLILQNRAKWEAFQNQKESEQQQLYCIYYKIYTTATTTTK